MTLSLKSGADYNLSPQQMTEEAEHYGVYKATKSTLDSFLMAIPAGVYIALAFVFYLTVTTGAEGTSWGTQHLLGGLVFSLGLILIVVCGGELFTSTTLTSVARASGLISNRAMIGCWIRVYAGNMVGALFTVLLIVMGGLYMADHGLWGLNALHVAQHKLHHSFTEAVTLGVLANMLVCLGIWMTFSTKDTLTRALLVILPVALFVSSGFEHSIANLFMVPLAIAIKHTAGADFWLQTGYSPANFADLTLHQFIFANLIPVTLGNIIGGGVIVGFYHWIIYRKPHLKAVPQTPSSQGADNVMDNPLLCTPVRAVMHPATVELAPSDPLPAAIRRLKENGLSAAPVIDNQRNLLGLLSEQEIFAALWADGFNASQETLVEQIMLSEPQSVTPDHTLEALTQAIGVDHEAAYPVSTSGILLSYSSDTLTERTAAAQTILPALFPVTEGQRLVGVISRQDLLNALLPSRPAKAQSAA